MARLSQEHGRRDGGYTRIFGNEELGQLVSRIHATSVAAGVELEKTILAFADDNRMRVDNLESVTDRPEIRVGIKLVAKADLKSSNLVPSERSLPDFVILDFHEQCCLVLEVTDGDTFDTKRVRPEVEDFEFFAKQLQQLIGMPASVQICAFNQSDKQRIVTGYKSDITIEQAMTGRELCQILGIDYDNFVEARKKDAPENLDEFVNGLLAIEEVRDRIVAKLGH